MFSFQVWIPHHSVAILGFGCAEWYGVFGLSNVVNVWIAEAGSLMYSLYLVIPGYRTYTGFVIIYSISRCAGFA